MKIDYLPRALRDLEKAPAEVRRAFFTRLKFLEYNLLHPSLHAKKYDESLDIWQARVTKSWRFYCPSRNDTYTIIKIIPHPK